MVITRKKLIEVALPLDAINKASAREKSIRHGHPSTLHLWWARRPLATARAVIFAQMVDDPSEHPDLFPTDQAQEEERQRLFRIIEELVKWENTTNETVLQAARDEIWQSWQRTCAENADHPQAKELFDPQKPPAFHDPFAGGGALPLEAQRLGLESYASDLNPVAVLINKAMIEIPPKFAGKPPVNPQAREEKGTRSIPREWKGAQGLAEDVRYYGQWMRDEGEKRIGHLYPKVEITAEMVKTRPDLRPYSGKGLTVIAWLWARTVKSPNPAFSQVDVPLASTFMLSTSAGKEAYIEPIIENDGYRFIVKVGKPNDTEAVKLGTTAGKRAAFRCLMSGVPVTYDHIKEQGKLGNMGARLMAIVADGDRGRVYISPTPDIEAVLLKAQSEWKPDLPLPVNPRDFKTPNYGLTTFADLFTQRQLVALTTFSDLVGAAREHIQRDALVVGLNDDGQSLNDGGTGATAYAEAVGVYLAFSIDKAADYWSAICTWHSSKELIRNTFGRQALPMAWDYVETNIFSKSSGNVSSGIEWAEKAIVMFPSADTGFASQEDAQTQSTSADKIVSTDPPYYDNIGYAELSDFFYVWLRRSQRPVFPDIFATLAVPKAEELVATPYRHGSKKKAETFFLDGMTQAMNRLAAQSHPAYPVTIYYAFKQSESSSDDGSTNTGWDTFLAAVIEAGFTISGTWPMRTELGNRIISSGTNALASSIVLVCRKRDADASTTTRREFVAALRVELPLALANLQHGNIAPVDLAQAAIGPGMQIYTRYAQVLNAEGFPLTVREALALINQTFDEVLAEQEGDFDADSRWALTWFEESGFAEGDYGVAEQLSKSKNTSVEGMVMSGILESSRGKVRLFRPGELASDWDPTTDTRTPAWESVHQLVRAMEEGGDHSAAELMSKMGGGRAEVARELAYRLYAICERKGWSKEGLSYNSLVRSWPEILTISQQVQQSEQGALL